MVGLQDFLEAMICIVELNSTDEYNLFNKELVSIRRLMQTVCVATHRKLLYLNVPTGLALALLKWAARRGIRLPVVAGSLQSLKDSQGHRRVSHLESIIGRETLLDESVERAVRALIRLNA